MTEAKWLACTGPTPMVEFLWGKAGDRKLPLLAAVLVLVLVTPLPAGVKPSDDYKLLLDGEELKDLRKQPAKGTAVGMTAQEIIGEDIDGKKFKLSNYRGRVVLLTFWGHW
jgi:hypothetical protein